MVTVLVIIAVVIVALFALLLFFNGRKKQADEQLQQHKPGGQVSNPDRADPVLSDAKPAPAVNTQTKSKIEEATYMDAENSTIGGDFYAEVAELFKQTLAEHPERLDLRAKLIEVYFDSGNKEEFVRQATAYHDAMDKNKDASWPGIFEKGVSLVPEHPLFGGIASSRSTADVEKPDKEDSSKPAGSTAKFRRFGDSAEAKPLLESLAASYKQLRLSPQYFNQLDLELLRTAGRPAHLMHAKVLSSMLGGAQIFIKREDKSGKNPRLHTHLMGQACIAKRLGKKNLIFAARNGEEAVIAAQAAARLSLDCHIYISEQAGKYRESHKFQVQLMGAEFIETLPGDESGDIRYAGLNAWLLSPEKSYMMLNMDAGPHPYPTIANDLQAVIGRECMRQINGKLGKLPTAIFARAGSNADAIGFVEPFISRKEIGIYLVSGQEKDASPNGQPATSNDLYGLLYSNKQKESANNFLDELEYPRVDREQRLLKSTGRLEYPTIAIDEAKNIVKLMARSEGLIFPMETAHVLAYACNKAKQLPKEDAIVIMLAERLNKDLLAISPKGY